MQISVPSRNELVRIYLSQALLYSPVALPYLLPPNFNSSGFNVPCYFDLEDLLSEVLSEMLLDGHLVVTGDAPCSAQRVIDEIMAGVSRSHEIGLSGEGGAAWEKFAEPDWNKFLGEETTCDHDDGQAETMTAWALQREFLEKLMAVRFGDRVDFDSKPSLRPCGTWRATYWREFSSGWRMDAKVRPRVPTGRNPTEKELRDRAEWSQLIHWHLRAWDHPAWPFVPDEWRELRQHGWRPVEAGQ